MQGPVDTDGTVPQRAEPFGSAVLTILSTAVVLGACLTLIRAYLLGFGAYALRRPFTQVPKMVVAAFYDILFVAGVTLLFLGLLYVVRHRAAARRALQGAYSFVAVLALACALLNVVVLPMLGTPLTYQWLYYSDFLISLDARNAILYLLSWRMVAVTAAVAVAGVGAVWLLRGVLRRLAARIPRRMMSAGAMAMGLLYFPFAGWYVTQRGVWDHAELANPTLALLTSMVARGDVPLLTMETTVGTEDFQVVAERPVPPPPPADPVVRNVLVYVMESVPAEYVEAYGGAYAVTPVLNAYRAQSVLFEHIYAHAPNTILSMVSILSATYPVPSYLSLTKEDPGAGLATLSGVLKRRGYRTAFFSSSDARYAEADRFLAHHRFDVVQDYRRRTCDMPLVVDRSQVDALLDGSHDACTAASLVAWMRETPEQPFFAMLWTNMTHYPYFGAGETADYGVEDPALNRYLNALRHGDQALGRILQALEASGLAASTLVVVVGDHGQAFGRHDQYAHASRIYEENVHVPLLLINPRLFHGERNATIGGLIDIAPTVLELLHLPLPATWQGRSLFSDGRSPRTYFFSVWTDLLFGYREGTRKYIFNATSNEFEIYDLQADPFETNNLAGSTAAATDAVRQRLAAWVQYQDRLINTLRSAHDF